MEVVTDKDNPYFSRGSKIAFGGGGFLRNVPYLRYRIERYKRLGVEKWVRVTLFMVDP